MTMILVVIGIVIVVVIGCVLAKKIGQCCAQCKANRILEINKAQERQITAQQEKLVELDVQFEDTENMMDEMDHRLDTITTMIKTYKVRPLSELISEDDEIYSPEDDSDLESSLESSAGSSVESSS